MMQEERETGARNPLLSKEVIALTALKKAVLREKAWQLAHGDKDPLLLETQRQQDHALKRGFDRLMESLPDEGQRIVACSRRLIERLEEQAIPMIWNPETGKYKRYKEEEDKTE